MTTEKAAHPSHYNAHPSGVEARLLIEHFGFNIGTAVKYLFRAGHKGGERAVDDIDKAIVYLLFEEERHSNGWPPIAIEPRVGALMMYVAAADPKSLLAGVLDALYHGRDPLECFGHADVARVRERLAARRPSLPAEAFKILHTDNQRIFTPTGKTT
jgi:hypothetical protein